MAIRPWVRLPSAWINEGGLTKLSWKPGGYGSDNTAALMALTAIAHAADQESGVARLTYDDICASTGLSRAKLSKGLDVLKQAKVIERGPEAARSTYQLVNYTPAQHWAKLPGKSMYSVGRIAAYADFQLRRAAELDALKLFFLFVARRGRDTNLANIGYDKIEEYAAIKRVRIKTAISFLASLSLIYVEHVPSRTNSQGVSNAYRIVGLDSYNHMGTRGRAMNEFDLTTG
jgi:hypothetical protein